jgi:hypothetical protein
MVAFHRRSSKLWSEFVPRRRVEDPFGPPLDPFEGEARARSACVVIGATPNEVAAFHVSARISIRANRLGTLVLGRLGSLPVDYADRFAGPVYDVLFNPTTGWFSVTVFDGAAPPQRFEPGAAGATVGGYRRAPDILGATTPEAILAALDVPRELLDR